ncbi:MAG: 1,4-alpha-glucan branching protein GlgB [Candidatus Izemoplasmatales bacterium]|jgi:1,4-alpha-glucan branching enzyme|nr:1,4-alpha-glucan branching protein GlgB [Candidatus Izemoplasmatales bacterium]
MNANLTELEMYLFNEGKLKEGFKHFGAHLIKDELNQILGVKFSVYAPHAKIVSVVGDFNGWDSRTHTMQKIDDAGVFNLFIPDIGEWTRYKYCIVTSYGQTIFKADPYAFFSDNRPDTSSKVYDIDGYYWNDSSYIENRKEINPFETKMAIYEVHLGSWMTKPDGTFHKYNEMVDYLIPYVKAHGFSHIELMPIVEHPLDESWGYQGTGYYSATARYGVPKDLMYLIDKCHQENIGVIFDWVPGHICKDAHGLYMFDGEPLYEYSDFQIRENVVWGTVNLDLGKGVTKSFLISNAMFWMDYFHVDGFRIDAVSNILYYLGNSGVGTNYPAIEFLKNLSYAIKEKDHSVLLFAEDSTTYPNLTVPVLDGGLGFDFKWNMGWMNDTLKYFEKDPIHRKFHHDLITFGLVYTYSERFILPLSHDEVVHGKNSLVSKMPGDYWQKFANYRTLIGLQFVHPGKKLLFMGDEFAQMHEWKDKEELDWFLLEYPLHERSNRFVRDLIHVYNYHKPMFELDHAPEGFRWIDQTNRDQSIFIFARFAKDPRNFLVVVINMTPIAYEHYQVGVPEEGVYEEILNSDKDIYGGSNMYNGVPLNTFEGQNHGYPHSIDMKVAPLSISILRFVMEDTLF